MADILVTVDVLRQLVQPGTQAQMLDAAGQIMRDYFVQAFRRQAWDASRWPERYEGAAQPRPLNLAGFLRDFADGRTAPQPHRFQARPALTDSGQLRDALAYRVRAAASEVEAGVLGGRLADIARAHLAGGRQDSIAITPRMRLAIGEWVRRSRRPDLDAIKAMLRPVIVRDTYQPRLHARRFIGWTAELAARVRITIVRFIRGL